MTQTTTNLSASSRFNPPAAYSAFKGSPFVADRTLYSRISSTPSREQTTSFILPIRSGRAWKVPAGHLCRIITPDGPQVGDLNIWNFHNPRERFWASRTRQLHAAHVTTYDRLWSCLPFLRPMVTITGDSLAESGHDPESGRCHDPESGRCHDLLGTRCDPYINQMLSGQRFDFHCHSNLTRAVLPYGLTEFDVHDVLNVFQVTGLNRDDEYFLQPCRADKGDFFEFFAEMDVLCALSTCPGGDLSKWGWAKDVGKDAMVDCCRPLGVEVYKITDPMVLEGWKEPEMAKYKGMHGMSMPTFQGPDEGAKFKTNNKLNSAKTGSKHGSWPGSAAAQMQSELTKQRNLESANGQSAPAQSQATDNRMAPAEQSQVDREANYVEAADKIGTKMATDPASVTKEDGDLLHSRETKAFGTTEKGGIASQAQSLASENAGDKK